MGRLIFLVLLLSISAQAQTTRFYLPVYVSGSNGVPINDADVDLYTSGTSTKVYDLTYLSNSGGAYYNSDTISTGTYDIYINGNSWRTGYYINTTAQNVAQITDRVNGDGNGGGDIDSIGVWKFIGDQNYKTPQMYGAVTGDNTVDRFSIQRAIDSAKTDTSIVYFPPGTYVVDSRTHPDNSSAIYRTALLVHSETRLVFDPRAKLRMKANQDAQTAFIRNRNITSGDSNIYIYGANLDGNSANQTLTGDSSHHGISFLRVTDFQVKDCFVEAVYGKTSGAGVGEGFAYDFVLCSNGLIEGNTAVGSDSSSTGFSANGSTALEFVGNIAYGFPIAMGFTMNSCADIIYQSNVSYDNLYGFNCEVGKNIIYDGCIAGVKTPVGQASHPRSANTAVGNAQGFVVLNGAGPVIFSDCVGAYSTGRGMWINNGSQVIIDGGSYHSNGTFGVDVVATTDSLTIAGVPLMFNNSTANVWQGANYNHFRSYEVYLSRFNVKTDGSRTDVQINNAINAVYEGGTVFFDVDTVKIGAEIRAKNNVTLDFMQSVILPRDTTAWPVQTGFVSVKRDTNVTLRGLRIDGRKANFSESSGWAANPLLIMHSQNVKVYDAQITNADNPAIAIGGAKDVLITGGRIDRVDGGAITIETKANFGSPVWPNPTDSINYRIHVSDMIWEEVGGTSELGGAYIAGFRDVTIKDIIGRNIKGNFMVAKPQDYDSLVYSLLVDGCIVDSIANDFASITTTDGAGTDDGVIKNLVFSNNVATRILARAVEMQEDNASGTMDSVYMVNNVFHGVGNDQNGLQLMGLNVWADNNQLSSFQTGIVTADVTSGVTRAYLNGNTITDMVKSAGADIGISMAADTTFATGNLIDGKGNTNLALFNSSGFVIAHGNYMWNFANADPVTIGAGRVSGNFLDGYPFHRYTQNAHTSSASSPASVTGDFTLSAASDTIYIDGVIANEGHITITPINNAAREDTLLFTAIAITDGFRINCKTTPTNSEKYSYKADKGDKD